MYARMLLLLLLLLLSEKQKFDFRTFGSLKATTDNRRGGEHTQLCGARDERAPSTSSTVSSAAAFDE